MDLSDPQGGAADPSRVSGWLTLPPPRVSRVASDVRVQTCRRHCPGGTTGEGESFPGEPVTAAFPVSVAGRPPPPNFLGLLRAHSPFGPPPRGAGSGAPFIGSFLRIGFPTTAPPSFRVERHFSGGM